MGCNVSSYYASYSKSYKHSPQDVEHNEHFLSPWHNHNQSGASLAQRRSKHIQLRFPEAEYFSENISSDRFQMVESRASMGLQYVPEVVMDGRSFAQSPLVRPGKRFTGFNSPTHRAQKGGMFSSNNEEKKSTDRMETIAEEEKLHDSHSAMSLFAFHDY